MIILGYLVYLIPHLGLRHVFFKDFQGKKAERLFSLKKCIIFLHINVIMPKIKKTGTNAMDLIEMLVLM